MEQLEFTATEDEAGVRIDRCLSDKYEELSRSYLQKLLKEQGVTVNGKAVKANYKIQAGDLVQTTLPDLTEPDILPENIPFPQQLVAVLRGKRDLLPSAVQAAERCRPTNPAL